MASISLTRMWVHRLDDIANPIDVEAMRFSETRTQGGGVRVYAGGTRRSIQTDENTRTITYEFPLLDRTKYNTLRGWLGQSVLVRDQRGNFSYGSIYSVSTSEDPDTPDDKVRRASWSINEISFSPDINTVL